MRSAKILVATAFASALLASSTARAQDGGDASPDDIKKKVLEIERLMKDAEEALSRSTDTRSAEERAAEAAKKMLDEKAKKETGKSAEDLRKEAAGGSEEARKALERLTQQANDEAKSAAEKMKGLGGGGSGGAAKGVKELIEKIKGDGKAASEGIQWILAKTKPQGGGSPSGQQQPQQNAPDPKKPEKKPEDKPDSTTKKPPEKLEPPRNPEFEKWIADLPAQIRKAVETEDWDSIPPKWREILKDYTKKMAEETDPTKERR